MKIVALVLVLIFSFSCQKKNIPERLTWKTGQSKESLQKIEQQEWSEKSTQTQTQEGRIVITQQSFLGIPIENSYLKKVYGKDQSLTLAIAQFFNPPELKQVRGLSFDDNAIIKQIKIFRNEFSSISVISNFPVFLNFENRLEPYYKISFFDRRGEPWSAYANQKNSIYKIIREGSHFNEQLNEKLTVESHVFPLGPKFSGLTEVLFEQLNLKPTLSNNDVVVTSDADNKILQLEQSIKFDPKDTRFDQVQVFYFLNKSLQWAKSNLHVQFSTPLEVVVHVGFPERTNTAFYYQNKIRLGSGDDQAYTNIPHDPTIVSHESFHYLIDHVAGLPYEGEGGSLNEAFADFFTCILYGRPRLAETAYLKAPFKRTLENDFKLSDKNGGLYHDSLIVSGLLWDVSKKIGADKTQVLAFEVLKKLHRYSTFDELKLLLNEQIQNSLTTQDRDAVKTILQKRGFGA